MDVFKMLAPETAQPFHKDQRGAILFIFALALPALLAACGLALDLGIVYSTRSKLSAALDSAAIAAARMQKDDRFTEKEVFESVTAFYQANTAALDSQRVTLRPLQVSLKRTDGTVTLEAEAVVRMAFSAVAGYKAMVVREVSKSTYNPRRSEIAMSVDLSDVVSDQNLLNLQSALSAFTTKIGNDGDVRLGLAGFGSAINADIYADAATNGTSKDGCVTERTGFSAFTDADPRPGSYLNSKAAEADCPDAPVLPLTADIARVQTAIGDLRGKGNAAGHLGLAWGFYILSQDWQTFWPTESRPDDYAATNTTKHMLLISSSRFDKYYEAVNGDAEMQAEEICQNIRARGIRLFTVAFKAPKPAHPSIADCAFTTDDFFVATKEADLTAALNEIAVRISADRTATSHQSLSVQD